MITIANHNEKITPEIVSNLPDALKKSHENFDDLVNFYEADEGIREAVDLYLELLNESLKKEAGKPTKPKTPVKPPKDRPPKKKKAEKEPKEKKPAPTEISYTFHEEKDFYFLKRFLNLLDKPKTRHQIGLYIKALQRAIVAKEIRKTSKYADHIMKVQDKLCAQFNKMKEGEATTLGIEAKWEDELKAIVNREKVYKSVMLIKRYISLAGKRAADKVTLLLKAIENAFKKQEITKGDPYYEAIDQIRKNLKKSADGSTVKIEHAELSGLKGVIANYEEEELNGCMCEGPISSLDFAKVKFNTLGFKGKWRAFVGDPTPGFTALIYGKPKSGKSTLSAQFAKYLADNHGKVLYVAKEEGKTGLLQERLKRVGALDGNLYLDDQIRDERMKDYEYVVLDSVHKLGFNEQVLDELPKKYPHMKGFLFIMHSTKGGDFRGSQTFAHNVDILIDVDRSGVATQIGRFAQGSEMEIDFDNSYKAA